MMPTQDEDAMEECLVLRTFRHHTGPVRCLALLPDGLRFVSGSVDPSACIVEHGLAPHFLTKTNR